MELSASNSSTNPNLADSVVPGSPQPRDSYDLASEPPDLPSSALPRDAGNTVWECPLYPPHQIEWRTDSYSGQASPVLMFSSKVVVTGILIVRVKSATHLYKTHNFGKPDPYVEVKVGNPKEHTWTSMKTDVSKVKDRHIQPVWDTNLQFSIAGNETKMEIIVYNKKTMGRDLIGRAEMPLMFLLQVARPSVADQTAMQEDIEETGAGQDPSYTGWVQIGRTSQQRVPAGRVKLEFTFIPYHDQQMAQNLSAIEKESKTHSTKSARESVKSGKSLTSGLYHALPEHLQAEIRRSDNIARLRKGKGQREIFGGPLSYAMGLSSQIVPKVMYDTSKYISKFGLTEEGVFRVPGNNENILTLRAQFNKNIDVGFNNIHDAAGILKLYIRELPTPLVPFNLYKPFLRCDGLPQDQMHAKVKELVLQIPKEEQIALRYLSKFLNEVSQHSEKNKMTAENLAMVFAPNIFKNPENVLDVPGITSSQKITSIFILHYEALFPAEPESAAEIEKKKRHTRRDSGTWGRSMRRSSQSEDMMSLLLARVAELEAQVVSLGGKVNSTQTMKIAFSSPTHANRRGSNSYKSTDSPPHTPSTTTTTISSTPAPNPASASSASAALPSRPRPTAPSSLLPSPAVPGLAEASPQKISQNSPVDSGAVPSQNYLSAPRSSLPKSTGNTGGQDHPGGPRVDSSPRNSFNSAQQAFASSNGIGTATATALNGPPPMLSSFSQRPPR